VVVGSPAASPQDTSNTAPRQPMSRRLTSQERADVGLGFPVTSVPVSPVGGEAEVDAAMDRVRPP
jgi:hypothetical protein